MRSPAIWRWVLFTDASEAFKQVVTLLSDKVVSEWVSTELPRAEWQCMKLLRPTLRWEDVGGQVLPPSPVAWPGVI